jgi:hypothetical protein
MNECCNGELQQMGEDKSENKIKQALVAASIITKSYAKIRVTLVACMAHTPKKFVKAQTGHPSAE